MHYDTISLCIKHDHDLFYKYPFISVLVCPMAWSGVLEVITAIFLILLAIAAVIGFIFLCEYSHHGHLVVLCLQHAEVQLHSRARMLTCGGSLCMSAAKVWIHYTQTRNTGTV